MSKLTQARADARAASLDAEFKAWCEASPEARDPGAIERIFARTRGLLRQVRALGTERSGVLAGELETRMAQMRDLSTALAPERRRKARRDHGEFVPLGGPGGSPEALAELEADHKAEAGILGLRASFLLGRYARHFSGQPRPRCDAYLLTDMRGQLGRIMERMTELVLIHLDETLTERVDVLVDQLGLWSHEIDAIPESRRELSSPRRAEALLALAERHRAEWRVQVGDNAAATIRGGLVKRLMIAHEAVRVELAALAYAARVDEARISAAAAAIGEELLAWRATRAELKAARAKTTPRSRARGVQAAVAELMLRWPQLSARGALTAETISELCDRLGELERQLTTLVAKDPTDETSARLLVNARARLGEWETAWERARGA